MKRAMPGTYAQRREWRLGCQGGLLLRLGLAVPVVLLVVALVGVTACVRHLLHAAGAGGLAAWPGDGALVLAAGGFLLVSLAVVMVQAMRVAHRVAGPEYRLIQTLRRIRSGDLTMRVHLRAGDLLGDLAKECNALLEWLNRNPPSGAVTGSDVLDLESLPVPDPAHEPAGAEP